MNREELKQKLIEAKINPKSYSLYGDLEPDCTILYQNYHRWQIFYMDERGGREMLNVCRSEEDACDFFYECMVNELHLNHQYSERIPAYNSNVNLENKYPIVLSEERWEFSDLQADINLWGHYLRLKMPENIKAYYLKFHHVNNIVTMDIIITSSYRDSDDSWMKDVVDVYDARRWAAFNAIVTNNKELFFLNMQSYMKTIISRYENNHDTLFDDKVVVMGFDGEPWIRIK